MSTARDALLRTLCFHAAWDHAPTLPELINGLDVGPSADVCQMPDVLTTLEALVGEGSVRLAEGKYALPSMLAHCLDLVHERDILQPRKRRAARQAMRWLVRLSGVRFAALANTTALGTARDGGDLDLFVVTRAGGIWAMRLLSAGPLRLLGKLPTAEESPDAVCLSYFISERGLDLSLHMLSGDDPYFRHWFLSLLPLVDDGIGRALWDANAQLLRRHPFARRWTMPPDLCMAVPRVRIGLGRGGERVAEAFQRRWFPRSIREMAGRGTEVMLGPDVLKFHVDDRRAQFKQAYEEHCRSIDVAA